MIVAQECFAEVGLRMHNSHGQEAPDIWSSGARPLVDFANALVLGYDDRVVHEPLVAGRDNYLYVRAQNYAPGLKTQRIACMYYTIPQLIWRPDLWVMINTDSEANFSSFPSMKAEAIAAAKEPFLIKSAEPADGYELIAQINDRSNTLNPKPHTFSAIERAQFFDNPLWSKIDVFMNDAQSPYLIRQQATIDVPISVTMETVAYVLTVSCQGCRGAKLNLEGSRSDANNKPIQVNKIVEKDGLFCEELFYFKAGFHAMVTLFLQTDDLGKLDKPRITVTCHEAIAGYEAVRASKKGLLYKPVDNMLGREGLFIKAGCVTFLAN